MIEPEPNRALAPATTLEVGGRAEHFVRAETDDEIRDALRWAAERGMPVTVLGGGSNVVVADRGVQGVVLAIATRGVDIGADGAVSVAAGEDWDGVVAAAVADNLAGIECLSGIPGTAGATPIQNVGAYGQEVASVIEWVRVLHRDTLEERVLTGVECSFGYRSSVLRRPDSRWIVLEIRLRLGVGGAPTLSYAQVAERFPGGAAPSLSEVRAAVLELRRSKSMVLDPEDPNRRSAGSFFVNPVVGADVVDEVTAAARLIGVLEHDRLPPAHDLGDGRVKLSAAWLIEAAGFPRGCRRGNVGLSSNHALAVVNRGGATAAELVDFARDIRRGVRSHLGVDLHPEPVFLGFPTPDPTA